MKPTERRMLAGPLSAGIVSMSLGLAACSGSGGGMDPPPANAAPTLTSIDDQSTDQDIPLTLQFSVADRESPASSLTVSASAGDAALFPADGLVLSGDGGLRTLTLTPLEAASGTATISVNVVDPQGASAMRHFQVAVNVRNASMRSMALDTFAKGEADEPTTLNGWTVQQDADDPAVFAPLVGEE